MERPTPDILLMGGESGETHTRHTVSWGEGREILLVGLRVERLLLGVMVLGIELLDRNA